ncbi:hypothetical protein G3I70_35990 [Actinomadura bangladeshensis]|uniref:Secreted protein n=2 Tax=Actinomadura bangladeshensis TaxID=453573 RepID=A0A6L9QT86_9ACTN|nr:hypothetical protein [Actinomadura bangladeshensis]
MRSMKKSKRVARLALPLAGVATAMALTSAMPAQAAPALPALNPDPIPASFDFSDCPALLPGYTNAGSVCFSTVVTSGTFKLGNFDQTIDQPIRMTFATQYNPTERKNTPVFGKMRAEKMLVQPGLFGDPFLSAVYAQPEYANLFELPPSTDYRIKLGLKVRLINPLLGGSCRIGSDSNPITLNLTTGTTSPPAGVEPLTGEAAQIVKVELPMVVRSAKHVDNTAPAPGAKGCALNGGLVNSVVNLVAGLPNDAGDNAMVFNEYIASKSYTALGS